MASKVIQTNLPPLYTAHQPDRTGTLCNKEEMLHTVQAMKKKKGLVYQMSCFNSPKP